MKLGNLGPVPLPVLQASRSDPCGTVCAVGPHRLRLGAWGREGGGQTYMLTSIPFQLLGDAPREGSQQVSVQRCELPSLGARLCLRDSPWQAGSRA